MFTFIVWLIDKYSSSIILAPLLKSDSLLSRRFFSYSALQR